MFISFSLITEFYTYPPVAFLYLFFSHLFIFELGLDIYHMIKWEDSLGSFSCLFCKFGLGMLSSEKSLSHPPWVHFAQVRDTCVLGPGFPSCGNHLANTVSLGTCGFEDGACLLMVWESAKCLRAVTWQLDSSTAANKRASSWEDLSQHNYTKVYFQDEFHISAIFWNKLFFCFSWGKKVPFPES